MSLAKAVRLIEREGVLLVFPLKQKSSPLSLWDLLHPGRAMRWEWDDSADPRVVDLWHLRSRLAESKKVVYAKWFRGRATLFSRSVFQAMLQDLRGHGNLLTGLDREARELLELLEDNSPQSTKELRRAAGLQGKALEGTWQRALSSLWLRLLIVGTGEVADGAFPSLSVGATRLVFEDLWEENATPEAHALLRSILDRSPSLGRELARARSRMEAE